MALICVAAEIHSLNVITVIILNGCVSDFFHKFKAGQIKQKDRNRDILTLISVIEKNSNKKCIFDFSRRSDNFKAAGYRKLRIN